MVRRHPKRFIFKRALSDGAPILGMLDAATAGVITRKLGTMVCVRSALGHVDEGVEPLALI